MSRRAVWRPTSGILLIAALAVVATACVPEPAATDGPSPSSTSTAVSPSPSPTETAVADGGDMALPATCDELYSPELLGWLQAQLPPLNDPGTTMTSTENAVALDVLASGVPTLRCSWGPPSERGLATNITIVSPTEAVTIGDALVAAGLSATAFEGGTLYEITQQVVTQDDDVVELGEKHYLRGDGWVSTRWINVHPVDYTETIVASLWG